MGLQKKVIYFICILIVLSSSIMGPLSFIFLKSISPLNYFFFISGISLVGMVAGAAIFYRFLDIVFIKRIKGINEGLISLRNQEGKELVIEGSDEITQLTKSFNDIIHNLQDITISQKFFNNIIQTVDNSIIVLTGESLISFANEKPSFPGNMTSNTQISTTFSVNDLNASSALV